MKQQLFEEHLPSLLKRSFKRRYKVANDRQKVQEEVGWNTFWIVFSNMDMSIELLDLIMQLIDFSTNTFESLILK